MFLHNLQLKHLCGLKVNFSAWWLLKLASPDGLNSVNGAFNMLQSRQLHYPPDTLLSVVLAQVQTWFPTTRFCIFCLWEPTIRPFVTRYVLCEASNLRHKSTRYLILSRRWSLHCHMSSLFFPTVWIFTIYTSRYVLQWFTEQFCFINFRFPLYNNPKENNLNENIFLCIITFLPRQHWYKYQQTKILDTTRRVGKSKMEHVVLFAFFPCDC